MAKRPVYYMQTDGRWKAVRYAVGKSKATIGGTGCGPACAAMIAATWLDPAITPVETAAWAVENGYRTADNGTAWALFQGFAERHKLPFLQTGSHSAAFSCVKDGGLVVCIMGPGRWTTGGHYILWYACEGSNVLIHDPASKAANRARAPLSVLRAEVRCYFCFWPPVWPALQKLTRLGVISSPEYWMAHWDEVKYLDKLILKGAEKAARAGTAETDIEKAVKKLSERGVIGVPEYWLENSGAIAYLDALICKLAGAV